MNFLFFKKKLKHGFTLIELTVVIAIAVIIMTALIVQNKNWNDHLALKTQAYELALMIRQAQIYSLGVKEDRDNAGDKFNIGYGVYMSVTGGEKVVLFADRDGDHEYDSPDEKIENKILTREVIIDRICRNTLNPCPGNGPKKVSVSFFRPETKAYTYFRTASGVLTISGTAFMVLSLNGSEMVIKVNDNGQISISE